MGAFLELMLTDGIDAVTVDAIAARANVGRSTFYTHFKGRDGIIEESLRFPSLPLARAATEWMEPRELLPIVAHFQQQRTLARQFAAPSLRKAWVRCLAGLIEPGLAALARRGAAQPGLSIALIATLVAELQVGMLMQWLASRESSKPLAFAEAIVPATRAAVVAMLGCDAGVFMAPSAGHSPP